MTHNCHQVAARNGWLHFGEPGNMTKSSPSDTQQQDHTPQPRVHGESQEQAQAHTGEGAASALARILQQDKKRRSSQDGEPAPGNRRP